ncbi:substrate-binding domain-containing protein [Streptomyces sp. 35G-GA-8]|uniref:substrate-binding domain-containing protein n=1 Tax=Streptomyces sp. 35G-GA-8 TaxID=2939434 RepID=UPI00201E7B9E|nr:substrate-binding domain-containing protein [Streptomyces sp. 35G-GA-8]MCL7375266.1 substrate-binding domain-containing protein [Streptomyces sp. 35G-GA-8]
MNVKSRARLGAVVGAAALGVGLLAPVASADPAVGEYRQLAGVGSDTTQDVLNRLGAVIPDPDGVPDGQLIASYNATGTATIKTRATGCVINRPNGSSAGIDALRNAVLNSTGCLDFARSSRGPVDTTTTKLTWIPFAKDAVTIAVRSDSALNNNLDLTTANLRDIYTCVKTTHNGVALTPLLPQSGSGTRSFFLEKIGVTEAQIGTCVNGTVQEHDGTALDSAGDIAPYSVAQYIAQTNGVVTDRHGVTVLGKVNTVAPRNADGTLNVNFPYNRDVYNVVPSPKITGSTADPNVVSAFVGTASKVCGQPSHITAFGFGTIGTACGATTLKGER